MESVRLISPERGPKLEFLPVDSYWDEKSTIDGDELNYDDEIKIDKCRLLSAIFECSYCQRTHKIPANSATVVELTGEDNRTPISDGFDYYDWEKWVEAKVEDLDILLLESYWTECGVCDGDGVDCGYCVDGLSSPKIEEEFETVGTLDSQQLDGRFLGRGFTCQECIDKDDVQMNENSE